MTKEEFLNNALPYVDFDAIIGEYKITPEMHLHFSDVCTNVLIMTSRRPCDVFTIAHALLKDTDVNEIGLHHNVLLNYVAITASMPENIKFMARFAQSNIDVSELLLLSNEEELAFNKRAAFLGEIKPNGVKQLYNVAVANDLSIGHYYAIFLNSLTATKL